MLAEAEKAGLLRLRTEQAKTLRDERFGGLSPAERSAYQSKQIRVRELENHLAMSSRNCDSVA